VRVFQIKYKNWSIVGVGVVIIVVCGFCISSIPVAGDNISTDPDQTPIDIETDRVSINLHTQRTTVDHDETVVFIHSLTNYVTNEKQLTAQLILEAPQGSQVQGAANAEAGTGSQYTTTTTLDPGEQENIRIVTDLNEPGTHEITGEVIYFYGDNPENGTGKETTIVVEQRPQPPSTRERIVGTYFEVYHWANSGLTTRLTTDGFLGFNPLSLGFYIILLVVLSSVFLILLWILILPLGIFTDLQIIKEPPDFIVGAALVIGVLGLVFTAIEFTSGQSNNPLLPRLLAILITGIPLLALLDLIVIGVTRWWNRRQSSY
jgi:hypothetical protein